MFSVLKKLLFARQIKFEEGKIVLFNQRINMVPVYSFATLQMEIEKIGKEEIIYQSMKKLGRQWTTDLQREYKTKHRAVIEWGINVVTLAGYGTVEIIKDSVEKKAAVYLLKDSSMVDYILKNKIKVKHPVDHMFRGMLAGTYCTLYNMDMDCVETKCRAKGDKVCEFVVKERSKFDLKDPKIKRQIA